VLTVEKRLEQLDGLIREPHLLNNQGIGNEIGFYIFDYDPKDELIGVHLSFAMSINT